MGFFGKGTLSRSEPTWLDREKKRRGLVAVDTSEELTRKRREERRAAKMERARRERETVERQLLEEGKLAMRTNHDGLLEVNSPANLKGDVGELGMREAAEGKGKTQSVVNENHEESYKGASTSESNGRLIVSKSADSHPVDGSLPQAELVDNSPVELIKEQEHLQLTFEEAFFLAYGLGVLQILPRGSAEILHTPILFELFRRYSHPEPVISEKLRPDDPFLVNYVVYHHFRSLGWVVRPGNKFAVTYLLYNRGPPFSHAEFAVVVLPAYTHEYWTENDDRATMTRDKQSKSWQWLHCVNRVQAQVMKTLVLAYVDIPPPFGHEEAGEEVNIGHFLQKYRVRDFVIRRWVANRNRD